MKIQKFAFAALLMALFISTGSVIAQTITIQKKIEWLPADPTQKSTQDYIPYFTDESPGADKIPVYRFTQSLPNNPSAIVVELSNQVYEPINAGLLNFDLNKIPSNLNLDYKVGYQHKKSLAIISLIPFRKNPGTGSIEKLVSFDVVITQANNLQKTSTARTYAANSVLAGGQWYKIGVTNDGVYKINADFLKKAGINVAGLNPKNIRIYGNGGSMVPSANSSPRYDDLVENSIQVVGENDGYFNDEDYILFYGQSPHRWEKGTDNNFHHKINLFSDTTFYYISIDLGPGKRIADQASDPSSPTKTVTSFNDYVYHDQDSENFLKSGTIWYGEVFDILTTRNISFNIPNIDTGSNVFLESYVGARSLATQSKFNVSVNEQSIIDHTVAAVSDAPGANYGNFSLKSTSLNVSSANINIQYTYTKPSSGAQGWLNYCELNVRRNLIFNGNQMLFRDLLSVGNNAIAGFNLSNPPQDCKIWDITNPVNITNQQFSLAGSTAQFNANTSTLKEFIAFNNIYLTPQFVEKVGNQNLHALGQYNMIIIAPDELRPEADRLANFHRSHDNLSVVVTSPKTIYNEFSSGKADISGIRDFVKMFYDRAQDSTQMPKHLLLFGDGSYDNKHRLANNLNFIPTFQTEESLSPVTSYTSDDFFACLDDTEGNLNDKDVLDLGVGRFPVKSISEAKTIVDKIINYASNPNTEGDWRNSICFIADDEDGDTHITQADNIASFVKSSNPQLNIDKIYLDSYIQESTPGGDRYPEATDAINKRMDKGSIIMNYTGHGGEAGLAHERVVGVSDINGWTNFDRLPLFFTATCQFSRFDDPERNSAGELVLLNPTGGGIALLTTVREVYSEPNYYLNTDFYTFVFKRKNGKHLTLGEIMLLTKTKKQDPNTRNFTLLGDPALTLSYPELNVATTAINNVAISAVPDTAKALSKITISGVVTDINGIVLTNYNGTLHPTIYDKITPVTTLGNDAGSPKKTFDVQKNVLYKGKATVVNGAFTFSFIVPKDISYKYGKGRISYYTENGSTDGAGVYENLIIGGTSNNPVTDVTGPSIKLYMNDEKFVYGGTTTPNPNIYSLLNDTNGINTVGNGIGHDITAIIDGDNEHTIVLNDYYESNLNSYQAGKLIYPFKGIKEGRHTLRLKAWDVYNNSSEANTEFVVAENAHLALYHVLNYPNPFTTHTEFYFEHNRPGVPMNVQVQIFSITGRLVKSINANMFTNGFRSDGIEWDGKDDYGDNIGKGVYIYRIKVKTPDSTINGDYEKLVILN